MKKNKGIIRSIASKVWLISILFLLLTILLFLSFPNYLFELQTTERLLKVKDYTEYKISVTKQKRPEYKLKFNYNDHNFYYDGIEEINISYGSTKTTIENILNKGFITYEEFMIKTTKENETEEEVTYAYRERPTKDILFLIIEKKDSNEIIFKSYDEPSTETKEEEKISPEDI